MFLGELELYKCIKQVMNEIVEKDVMLAKGREYKGVRELIRKNNLFT